MQCYRLEMFLYNVIYLISLSSCFPLRVEMFQYTQIFNLENKFHKFSNAYILQFFSIQIQLQWYNLDTYLVTPEHNLFQDMSYWISSNHPQVFIDIWKKKLNQNSKILLHQNTMLSSLIKIRCYNHFEFFTIYSRKTTYLNEEVI